jgi:hypothetical protein
MMFSEWLSIVNATQRTTEKWQFWALVAWNPTDVNTDRRRMVPVKVFPIMQRKQR